MNEPNQITDTSTFTRIPIQVDPALRLSSQGVAAEAAASVLPQKAFGLPQGNLEVCRFTAAAGAPQLLLLPADVEVSEVEALAVSLWEEAGWLAPGQMQLLPGVKLVGPWRLGEAGRKALGLPTYMALGFEVEVSSPRRSRALPDELRGVNRLADAFSAGSPLGNELVALEGLVAICRRLGAWLRVAPGQAGPSTPATLIAPEADSAVNLSLYAPGWLASKNLIQMLTPLLGQVSDHYAGPVKTRAPRQEYQATRQLDQYLLNELGAAELARLAAEAQAFDQNSLQLLAGQETEYAPYALYASVGHSSQLMLSVQAVTSVPQALRWEPWAKDTCVNYQLIWLDSPEGTGRLTRAQRQERLRVINRFELVARALTQVVGGEVLDQDGFLLNWED